MVPLSHGWLRRAVDRGGEQQTAGDLYQPQSGIVRVRVTGSNNDGVWNEAGRALTIVIVPPWWQTWWFRTLLLGSLVGLAVADDGRGFELATAAPDSFGQAIMRERASEIGAALQVRSGVGQGTTVTVVWT